MTTGAGGVEVVFLWFTPQKDLKITGFKQKKDVICQIGAFTPRFLEKAGRGEPD